MIVDRENALTTHRIPEEVGYFSPKHIKKNLVYGNQMRGMFLTNLNYCKTFLSKPVL